jgi:hypothetical protein
MPSFESLTDARRTLREIKSSPPPHHENIMLIAQRC